MNIESFESLVPELGARVYVDVSARVLGDVSLGDDASVWPMAVLRGDIHAIHVGARSNIQDGSVLHVTHDSRHNPGGFPLQVGEDVTVGHRVVLHGCRIGDRCLIGMGAVVMDGAVIESGTILGAGSLVTPGKTLNAGLWVGSPARRVRDLTAEEQDYLKYSAGHYVQLKDRYLSRL